MPLPRLWVHDAVVTDKPDGPHTPPPHAEYLAGISWRDALNHVELVAAEHPELSPRLLAWLIREARLALLDELPPHGPDQGWFKIESATWSTAPDETGDDAVSD